jgi:carboxymethylenebutenolidase
MQTAMRAAGKTVEVVTEPNTVHPFFNDSEDTYNAAAAADAWSRTLQWFRTYFS